MSHLTITTRERPHPAPTILTRLDDARWPTSPTARSKQGTLRQQRLAKLAKTSQPQLKAQETIIVSKPLVIQARTSSLRHNAVDIPQRKHVRQGNKRRALAADVASNVVKRSLSTATIGIRYGQQFSVGNIGHGGALYLTPVVRAASERARPQAAVAASAMKTETSILPTLVPISRPPSDQSQSESLHRPHRSSRPQSHPNTDQSARMPVRSLTVSQNSAWGKVDARVTRARSRDPQIHTLQNNAYRPTGQRVSAQSGSTYRSMNRLRMSSYDMDQLRSSLPSDTVPQEVLAAVSRRHSEMSQITRKEQEDRPTFRDSAQSHLALITSQDEFVVHAAIFDRLERNPMCPDLIQFSKEPRGTKSRRILKATPLALVAECTSSSFVNYELVNDFFMTFRQFMRPAQLLEILHDRFLWGVFLPGRLGVSIRVRTFVALRHWVMNYMNIDFAPDHALRVQFCDLVNDLYYLLDQEEMPVRQKSTSEITQLKKCWRIFLVESGLAVAKEDYEDPRRIIEPGANVDTDAYGALAYAQGPSRAPEAVAPEGGRIMVPGVSTTSIISRTSSSNHGAVKHSKSWRALTEATLKSKPSRSSTRQQPRAASAAAIGGCKGSRAGIDGINGGRRGRGPLGHEPQDAGKHLKHSRSIQFRPDDIMQQTGTRQIQGLSRKGSNMNASLGQSYLLSRSSIGSMPMPALRMPGDIVLGRSYRPRAPEVDNHVAEHTIEAEHEDIQQNTGVRAIITNLCRALSQSKYIPHTERKSVAYQPPQARHTASQSASAKFSMYEPTQFNSPPATPVRKDFLSERALFSFNRIVADGQGRGGGAPAVYAPHTFRKLNNGADPHWQSDHLPIVSRAETRAHSANVTQGSRSIVIGLNPTPRGYESRPGESASEPASHNALNEEDEEAAEGKEQGLPAMRVTHYSDDSDQQRRADNIRSSPPLPSASAYLGPQSPGTPQSRSLGPQLSPDDRASSYRSSMSISEFPFKTRTHAYHQHKPSDPITDDDPQPIRSLRRREGAALRGGMPDFSGSSEAEPERVVSAAGFQAVEDRQSLLTANEPRFSTSSAGVEAESPDETAGPLGQAVEDVLREMTFPEDMPEDGTPEAALLKLEGKHSTSPVPDAEYDEAFKAAVSQIRPKRTKAQEKFRHRHEHVVDASAPIQEPSDNTILEQSRIVLDEVDDVKAFKFPPSGEPSPEKEEPRLLRLINPDRSGDVSPAEDPGLEGGKFAKSRVDPGLQPHTTEQARFSFTASSAQLDRTDTAGKASHETENIEGMGLSTNSFEAIIDRSFGQLAEANRAAETNQEMFALNTMWRPSTPPSSPGESRRRSEVGTTSLDPSTPIPSPPHITPKSKFVGGVYMPSRGPREKSPSRLAESLSVEKPEHYPFVLKHDAMEVAKALTVVEVSALEQLNWQELIELSWTRTGLETVRDWAAFVLPKQQADRNGELRKPRPTLRSVDVIIARFNVVTAWAISEILLINSKAERVACITQFVKIALASRELRNFATLYQITVALLSADVAELKNTWAMVEAKYRDALTGLEELIRPTKNFGVLRAEQESVVLGKGCVPFFGMYANDLILNETKVPFSDSSKSTTQSHSRGPSRALRTTRSLTDHKLIASSAYLPSIRSSSLLPLASDRQDKRPGRRHDSLEPMVDFERCQSAAATVRTVLRLAEASREIRFEGEEELSPELVSRCLWLVALSDEEIRARVELLNGD